MESGEGRHAVDAVVRDHAPARGRVARRRGGERGDEPQDWPARAGDHRRALDQQQAPFAGQAQGAGRLRRVLDLRLIQLQERDPAVAGLARAVQCERADHRRCPRPGVRVGEALRQGRGGDEGAGRGLSGGAGQRFRDLEALLEPLLAGGGDRRQAGHRPLHPHRRGGVRRDGSGDPTAARGAVKRRDLLIFAAVLLASAILAVLAALSLRQWEASAERHVHEQARDMATMAAEKVEMAVLKGEEEACAGLQLAVLDLHLAPERVDAWKRQTAIFDRAYLFDQRGRLLYPAQVSEAEAASLAALRAEIAPGFWDRGGRRHVRLDDQVALVAVIQGSPLGPLLAVLVRSEHGLRRDIIEKTLVGLEGQSVVAVLDGSDRV